MTTVQTARRWTSIASLWIALILIVIEALIGTRFVLLLSGAGVGNSFVDFIYDVSDPFVSPFEGIFDNQTVGDDGIFEPASLIALIVYPIIALLLGALLRTLEASAPRPKADVWGSTARDLYVRLSSLQGSLAASAALPATTPIPADLLGGADAQIDELSASLHSLELDPPGERASIAVRDVIVTLNDVRASLRAEATEAAAPSPAEGSAPPSLGIATGPRVALREHLAAFDTALQSFRAAI